MTSNTFKITHVIPNLQRAGAEVLLTDLLPRLAARGPQVDLVAFSDTSPLARVLTERGIRIEALGHRGGTIYRLDRWMTTAKELWRRMQVQHPAIVHSHLYMSDILTRLVSSHGTMLVSTLPLADPWWERSGRLRSKLKTYLDGCLARWRSVHLIAVSQDTACAAVRALGVNTDRIRVIYNGIDLERFSLNRSRAFPREPSSPCFVQIGRMDEQKGHSVALEAFRRVLEVFPKAKLLFVGDGPLRTRLESQARELSLDGRVRFLGIRSDIPALL